MKIKTVSFKNIHQKGTRRETLIKFILLLTVLITYFFYLSYKYGFETGGIVSALTWSFFVLCTPIADAGFLLDFPIRLLFGIRMMLSEIIVWTIAISLNIFTLNFHSEYYKTTFLTSLFHKILTTPYPYWSIILLSCLGTFLSLYFGDEMLDVMQHKDCKKQHKHGFKYKVIATIGLFLLIIFAYYNLLDGLGIDIDKLENK